MTKRGAVPGGRLPIVAERPVADAGDATAPEEEVAECLRCRLLMRVDEDGFCAACAKAIEQACL